MTEPRPLDVLVAGVGFVGSYILAEAATVGLSAHGVDLHPTTLASELSGGLKATVRRADFADSEVSRRLLEVGARALVVTSRLGGDDGAFAALANVIEYAAAAGTTQVILISSLAVYGEAFVPGGPRETTSPINPSPYGLNKLAEETAAVEAAQRAGVRLLILRSSGLFGRLPTPRPTNRSAGSIDRAIRQHLAGERPVLSVEDAPDQYLYSRELGAVVVEAVIRPPLFDVMNVGPGYVVAPEYLREALESTLGVIVTLRLCGRTGPAIQALNVDRINAWHSARVQARSHLRLGLVAAMRDFETRNRAN